MANGPELISQRLMTLAQEHHNRLVQIQPGKLAQNGYIERSNRPFREKVLEAYLCSSLEEVRQISNAWMVKLVAS